MSTTFADRARALHERLDAPEPTTWRPDDPEHPKLLVGELVGVTAAFVRSGPAAGQKRQIAILRDGEGALWNVWLLHKVLIDEFCTQQPKTGEMLAIRYDGRVTNVAQPYEKYRLVVERNGGSVEWQAVQGVDAQPAADPAPAREPEPAPAAPQTETVVRECEACGMRNGYHAENCPLAQRRDDDIPF